MHLSCSRSQTPWIWRIATAWQANGMPPALQTLVITYSIRMNFISNYWHVSAPVIPGRWRDAFIAAWEATYNWQNSITLASTLCFAVFTAHWTSHLPGHRSICTPGKPSLNSRLTTPWSVFRFLAHQRCWSNAWWWIKSRIFCWYHGEHRAFICVVYAPLPIHFSSTLCFS